MQVVSIRMPLELWRDAKRLAEDRGQTLGELVRDAMERELVTGVDDWRSTAEEELQRRRDREHWRVLRSRAKRR